MSKIAHFLDYCSNEETREVAYQALSLLNEDEAIEVIKRLAQSGDMPSYFLEELIAQLEDLE